MESLINVMNNDGTANNWTLIIICSIIGLVFMKGCYEIFKALRSLRHVRDNELNEKAGEIHVLPTDPLSVVAAKTLRSAYADYSSNPSGSYSTAFLKDATRQLAEHLFESKFIRPITMCSNILPPIGFIGTVLGMIFVFFGGGDLSHELNSAGLGIALFSTLFALFFFVILEAAKILLSKRLHAAIERGLVMDIKDRKKMKVVDISN